MRFKTIYIGENNTNGSDIHLRPGKNLYTGLKPFEDSFGGTTSLEKDMLNLASGIYASDLAVLRNEREHYIRSIELTVEVSNYYAFNSIKDYLEKALYTVSKDNWSIKFVRNERQTPVSNVSWENKEGAVLLFSGGIDSMSAASEFIKNQADLVLVSHNTHGNRAVDKCQNEVHKALESHYKRSVNHLHIKVYGRNHSGYSFPRERENTQRTRSFLFLVLAALVTRRSGFNKVLYMAENGQFAIHLPLNQSRVGPFSTHTADPEFALITRDIIRILLDNQDFDIINPFLYMTKSEVFGVMPKPLQEEAKKSGSCWMIHRNPGEKHCGYCIPCLSRRIAIEYNGLTFDEYVEDMFNSNINSFSDEDDRKRNLIDYLEFISKFKTVNSANSNMIMAEFPELYNSVINTDEAMKLYERVSNQSYDVLNRYPEMTKLIG